MKAGGIINPHELQAQDLSLESWVGVGTCVVRCLYYIKKILVISDEPPSSVMRLQFQDICV